jgi:hypothetical protein
MSTFSNQFDEFPDQVWETFKAGHLCLDIALEELARNIGRSEIVTTYKIQGDCDQDFQIFACVGFDRDFTNGTCLWSFKIK